VTKKGHEWNPLSEDVLSNQIAAYDRVRSRCPVAHGGQLHWSLFRHEDVMRVLHSPNVFSNAVSGRLAVPNGFDPPEHTAYGRNRATVTLITFRSVRSHGRN
jgi:cytochrome P450